MRLPALFLVLARGSCQLDTHLNDATPREERSREPREEEAWQQPPTLQHHDSNKRSQNKGGRSEREQGAPHLNNNPQDYGAQRPEVPGAVAQPEDDETRGEGTLACFCISTGMLVQQIKKSLPRAERVPACNCFVLEAAIA